MAAQKQGGQAPSPYVWESPDYQLNVIRITIVFNEGTRAITSVSVFRDPACMYTKLLIGIGPDGNPSTTTRSVNVPAGTTAVPVVFLNNRGITTIEDFLAFQITASP